MSTLDDKVDVQGYEKLEIKRCTYSDFLRCMY